MEQKATERQLTERQLILEAFDHLNDIFADKMSVSWEDAERWKELEEVRTHILIAWTKFASLP